MATTDRSTTTAPGSTPDASGGPPRPRRTAWLAAAAVLVLVAVGIGGALTLAGQDPSTTAPPRPLALTAPDGAATASCVAFDVVILREMPVAFAGTVTAVTDDKVTLSVDRWYQGTAAQRQAEVVTLAVPGGSSSVALDGIELVQGERYLLTATDGAVNGCGFSGPAGPELEAAYAEAFGR